VSSCLQSTAALVWCGVLVGVFKMSHLAQPLTQMFPAFHSVLGHWYPTILDSPPVGFFFSYKKCPVLFSPLPTGEMILSGDKDGLVAVSSPRTGMTIRILADHKGSPITVLQCTRKQVRPRPLPRHCGTESPVCHCTPAGGSSSVAALVSEFASLSLTFPLRAPIPSSNFCSVFPGMSSVG